MIEIVQNGDPVLRNIAKKVLIGDIKKDKIQNTIKEMKQALHSQDDGVAIAAPQIGISNRIFIISGRVFEEDFVRSDKSEEINKFVEKKIKNHQDLVFINPVFLKVSKDKKLMSEGCLSVRPIYGKVRRASRITIEAYNEHGEKFIKEGSGLLAQIFQHETDHLDGILFIDKAKDLHEATSEEEYK